MTPQRAAQPALDRQGRRANIRPESPDDHGGRRRRAGGLLRLLAVVALVVGAGMFGGAPRLGPGPAYAGTTFGGAGTAPCVAVIVDARLAGGSVQTGCARRDPDTGLEALTAAGFSYTPRPRDGLICQIDGLPQCAETTTDRYWSYWYRPAGSSRWVYASQGAGTHDPAPGATEGWVWQDGGRREPPSTGFAQICPTRDREPSDPPASARVSGGGPTGEPRDPPATGKPRPVSTKSTATPTGAGGGSATASSPATPTGTPSPSSVTSSATATPSASGVAKHEPSDSAGGGGAARWVGLAVGAALVAVLAGAAWLRVRRTPGSGP